jgi:hypothetical protein
LGTQFAPQFLHRMPRETVRRLRGVQRRLLEHFWCDRGKVSFERTRNQVVARAWIHRSHPLISARNTRAASAPG